MGFCGKASISKEATEEKQAEEKLKLVLLELGMDKQTDTAYNENDYIDNKINEQEGMTVLENDIVSVDGWKFEIDRSVPKIEKSLGKEELNTAIQIEAMSSISSDYTKSTITIEVSYEGEIESITINGEEKELPEKQEDGKYVLSTDVMDNGDYEIIVKDKDGKYNREIIKISEIINDMYIYNKADMEKFRDIVNNGDRTFKDNTVYVMDEIYLEGSSSNQWIPIGTTETSFEGTFEGNNHTIDGIYMDSTESTKGLFRENKGTIQNLTISKNSYIKGNGMIGGMVGSNYGTINNVVNNGKVESTNTNTGGIAAINQTTGFISNCINNGEIISSGQSIGGITGQCYGEINKCANFGSIIGEATNSIGGIASRLLGGSGSIKSSYNKATIIQKSGIGVGGITTDSNGGMIENCYNAGTIISNGSDTFGGIIGYTGATQTVFITNCYNVGKLQTGSFLQGGITGNNENNKMQATNNYWLNTCGATVGIGRPSGNTNAVSKTEAQMKALAETLGEAYTNDIQNEDGTWKYNDGYPILKWQLEK